jgi:hypothetical protein
VTLAAGRGACADAAVLTIDDTAEHPVAIRQAAAAVITAVARTERRPRPRLAPKSDMDSNQQHGGIDPESLS